MSYRLDLGPKPQLGYTDSRIERAAELRASGDAVAALAAAPDARVYVVGGEIIVMKAGGEVNDPLFTFREAAALGESAELIFLGTLDRAGRWGFGLAPQAAEALKTRADLLVTDLRSVAVRGLVTQDHLPLIAQAKAMLHWHARHRFCSNCGAPTKVTQCGWRRD